MTSPAGARSLLLTPPGPGAVGLIRVTGPSAIAVTSRLFRPTVGTLPLESTPAGVLRYGLLVEDSESLDDVVVALIGGPDGPTVEIAAHGGVRVLEQILLALHRAGAPLTVPEAPASSEPTGGIDSEVMAALPSAKTARSVRLLTRQFGHLAAHWRELAEQIAASEVAAARLALTSLLATARGALRLVHGATVALVGPPNSGKSTLFNRLAGREAAVVSDRPGTTRDWISQVIELDGAAITLTDTAGLRDADDSLESAAIARGLGVIASADLRLRLADGSLAEADEPSRSAGGADELLVFTKADLTSTRLPSGGTSPGLYNSVHVSALTGQGLDELCEAVLRRLGIERGLEERLCLFTPRQVGIVTAVLSGVEETPREAADLLLQGAGPPWR